MSLMIDDNYLANGELRLLPTTALAVVTKLLKLHYIASA